MSDLCGVLPVRISFDKLALGCSLVGLDVDLDVRQVQLAFFDRIQLLGVKASLVVPNAIESSLVAVLA